MSSFFQTETLPLSVLGIKAAPATFGSGTRLLVQPLLLVQSQRGVNNLSFSVPDWIPIYGGRSWSPDIDEIPKLDEGGIVIGPTLAALAMDRQDEVVMPLRDLDMMMNGGRTMVFNVDSLVKSLCRSN